MSWMYTPYAGILWATAFLSAFVAWLISRRPKTEGSLPLELLLAAMSLWALTSGFSAASVGVGQKLFWAKIGSIGGVSTPTLFLIFALNYSLQRRWLDWRSGFSLSFFPALFLLAAWTNEHHGWIWASFTYSPTEPNAIIFGYGAVYFIFLAYGYILTLIGLMLLVRIWLKAASPYRQQTGFLLAGAMPPVITGILYPLHWTPFPGLNGIPVSFLVTGLILLTGILNHQLFDPMPIASDELIDNMHDGVMVLDAWDRIARINPFAEKLLDIAAQGSIGLPAAAVLTFWNNLQQRFVDHKETVTEVQLTADPPRTLEVHASPLADRRNQFAGRLLIFRDITERMAARDKLARNVEELKVVNHISLIVSSGLDVEGILKALYEQCSQVASVDVFYVAMTEPDSPLVNIPIYYEEGHFLAGASRDIQDNPGLIGSVIDTRETLYLRDNDKQVTHPVMKPNMVPRRPSRSYVGIPLIARNQVIGVMSVQNRRPGAYTEDQVHLLERIAMQAAIAIENARLYAKEQRLAIIDELTGIYNYRGLIELGNREIERIRRFNHPLSVLFFDIDGFRNLNNTYSHTAGNLVLRAVVDRCSSILRSVDIFVRFGGDEFVILLPETEVKNAEVVAKRLVEVVSASDIPTPYGNLRVGISVGVSCLTDANMDLISLIDRANQAEHFSKKSPQIKVNTAPLV